MLRVGDLVRVAVRFNVDQSLAYYLYGMIGKPVDEKAHPPLACIALSKAEYPDGKSNPVRGHSWYEIGRIEVLSRIDDRAPAYGEGIAS